MLTRPLTLSESDDRGRGQTTVTLPPALPLADEDDEEESQTVFSPPAPPWSSSSSSPSSPPPPLPSCAPSFPPPPPPCPLSHLPPVSPAYAPPLLLPSASPPYAPSLLFPAPAAPPSAPPPCALSPHLPCAPLILPPAPTPCASLLPPAPPPCTPSLPLLAALPPPTPPPCTPSLPLPAPAAPPPPPPSCTPSLPAPVPAPPRPAPPPPPPPPPCCPCSSLLPRLLSAHRLEMRRLLRGALASLGRRLDSLERRSRRKMRKKRRNRRRGREEEEEEEEVGGAATCSPGSTVFSTASLCGPTHLPPVSTSSSLSSSSSDSEDSTTPPLSTSLSQSEQRRMRRRSRGEEEEGEGRGRKRRRKNHRGCVPPENREEEEEEEEGEEEENAGRFVGRMVVSFRGGAEEEEEEGPLTLYNFSHRKHRRREGASANQSEKTVSVINRNGYRAPQLHGSSSFSSQHALHLLQSAQRHQTCSQSEALFSVSSGQWHFSDFTPPLPLSSNHSGFHLWLCSSSSSSSSISPAPMLRLSAVAVEMMSESVRGRSCWSPLRPLKDWTAPPSLSSDHCYVRTSSMSPTFSARRQQKQRANHSSRSLHLTRRWPMALPTCSTNRLSAPLPTSQSATCSEFLSTNGERGKRVSQIRIRRASPRETQLTPMGLPKVKRLKKKEFSLEEIYTNKNYKSPSTNRSLETIFEEPREKDGALLRIGHQRRRRLLLFPDFTQPRKRKRPQVAGLPPVAMVPRKRAAARRHCHGSAGDDESDLDVMLVERLSALEDFLTRQGLDV